MVEAKNIVLLLKKLKRTC